MTERVEQEEQAARDQQMLRSVGHGGMGGSMNITPLSPLPLSSPREQELSNLLQQEDYIRAVGLAITLDQPFRVLSILSGMTPLKALCAGVTVCLFMHQIYWMKGERREGLVKPFWL